MATKSEYIINPKCIRNGAGNEKKKSRYTNHLHRVVYHRGIAATGFEKCVRFERWEDKFRKKKQKFSADGIRIVVIN